jgi:hypothetical protein
MTVFVLAAIALSGCCALGNGCAVSTAGGLSNWDGTMGTGPDDAMMPEQPMSEPAQPSKKKMARGKTGMGSGEAEQGMAEDPTGADADAKMAKKLVICRNCTPSPRDTADAAEAAGRAMH